MNDYLNEVLLHSQLNSSYIICSSLLSYLATPRSASDLVSDLLAA